MNRIPPRVYLRYTLLQLPAVVIIACILLIVRYYLDLNIFVSFGILAAWIIKDIIMFPFVWRSYDSGKSESAQGMNGMVGVVTRRLSPEGYVRVRGELWRAVLVDDGTAEEGVEIQVYDRDGLLLRVRKVE